jgi:hypothetical protein
MEVPAKLWNSINNRHIAYGVVIVALIVANSIQVFTPLRLHPDTVVLLSVADSVAHGGNYLFDGKETVFPPGYPTLVAMLIKLGLSYSWALIGLNLVFLCAGILAVRPILKRFGYGPFSTLNICILSLLSFVLIRHFTIPLTDVCFFGVAMCCLLLMESAAELHGWELFRWIVLSWGAVALALAVRRVGLALVPALAWTTISHPQLRAAYHRCFIKTKTIAASLTVLAGTAIIWIVTHFHTLRDWKSALIGYQAFAAEAGILHFRMKELGEMTFNTPYQVLPTRVAGLLPIVGAFLFVVLLAGMVLRRKIGPTEVFILGYLAIIFVWPYYDPRFWLPIIPLVMAYVGLAMRRFMQFQTCRVLAEIYAFGFVVMGTFILLSSTKITFSGRNFPNLYGNDYHSTYCAVYQSCDRPDNDPINPAALHLLKTYK